MITIRPLSAGPQVISGFAWTVPTEQGTDELEWELPLTANESVPVVTTTNVRKERIKDGMRYRCGGYLVPIDAPERFTESDVDRDGIRGRPLESGVAFDSTRSLREAKEIWLAVVIDREGSVIESRVSKVIPIPVSQLVGLRATDRPPMPPVVDAAMEAARAEAIRAVRRWRFEPTRMRGQAINDWVLVKVRVEPLP